MPMLTRTERIGLLGPFGGSCRRCRSLRVRQYCRSCDEFFYECQCTDDDRPHVGHRTYRWVAGDILADPDFDFGR